ncbi:Dolichyl-phosphate beta-D-mannosyltransferase [Desulfofundulus kuznetsovii DSM 6115]|uniref:Dolichyl-phosphate beta-D-mannosyltransferase n=1 Tax=Desulfofundulus kuznetsovii (strain DSM 6115 / VKM B-1805 / 17) TaxID=760568 RepID=A0AAU8PBF8_DESK7|nr:Dolichyl-phosphate beta-D-mannosyltransferase [Desulfofundulus kuznetsovii DSM 6115]
MLTVIIPTYNEEQNIVPLTKRICRSLKGKTFEILFVDDSNDGTTKVLEELSRENPQVRFIHRQNQRGLATAVVEGFRAARGDVLAVMDADLQHPPEVLPRLLESIEKGNDLVIASRFVPGGEDGGLTPFRRMISLTARVIGRLALKKVRPVNDPLSGFFMLKKEVIEDVPLSPLGWKILMEVLVRGRYHRPAEVPYVFERRRSNHSKMNLTEQVNYLRHLVRLVLSSPEDLRFWKFCLVGTTGVAVNMFFFLLFTRLFSLDVVLSALLATSLAIFGNFLLNDLFTWAQQKEDHLLGRAVKFYLCSGAGMVINVAVLSALHCYLRIPAILANGAGILASTAWNYYANNRWTWASTTSPLANEKPDSQ